ncbi:protein of unknown function [Algoriphagus ornithinivorans]|uniref:DUF3857 domain-containing protein n=1 Tax=Algoriphagus ornithinivorans TaxID=226506 RepID=A0A1I5E7W7_9BACT|nr:DUF3857 domain-containing protein [Algoriphagus ornithinivorans]SFO07554.1 protein of unknown function [Algoriphagus ornithinivorans]
MSSRIGLIWVFIILSWPSFGQVSFGIYSKFEKELDSVFFEKEAKVVSLYEGGVTYPLIKEGEGWVIGLVTEYHFRYKILGDNPDNFGNITIPFFTARDLKIEQIVELRATVSYLDGDERKSIRLGDEHIFRSDNANGWSDYRIVFPQVKKGSILEWKYVKVDREYYLLEGWEFQGTYPKLRSEYTFQVPDYLRYQLVTQGTPVREMLQVSPSRDRFYWNLENIPSFRLEPYLSNPLDYVFRVEGFLFQDGTQFQPIVYSTWEELGTRIQSIPAFESYFKGNSVKKLGIKDVLYGTNDLETAEKIYRFVKDRFKVQPSIYPLPTQDARSLLKKGEGNHLDIHLTLLNLLQDHGITADLVLVNQKGENRTDLIPSPFLNQFSNSLVRLEIRDSVFWLDATDPYLSFGLIPPKKLVPQGFLIRGDESKLIPIDLKHNSGSNQMITVEKDSIGNWAYSINFKLEGLNVLSLRDQLLGPNPEPEDLDDSYYDITVDDKFQEEGYLFSKAKKPAFNDGEEIVILSPFKESIFYENPFLEARRTYPIDFDYPFYQNFELDMEIPEGYEVDEIPPSVSLFTPNKELTYLLESKIEEGHIRIVSKLDIRVKNYSPRAYPELKSFAEKVSESVQFPVILKKKAN